MLGRTMHGIDYDHIHDEIVVPQQFGQAILVFRGSARGEEPPIRVIQGSQDAADGDGPAGRRSLQRRDLRARRATTSWCSTARQTATSRRSACSAARTPGSRRPAPSPSTTCATCSWWAPCQLRGESGRDMRSSRSSTAPPQGNAKPKRVIAGPKSAARESAAICASIRSGGLIFVIQQAPAMSASGASRTTASVAPRFTVGGPEGILQKPRGLDLDPKHNAVIVSDKDLNAVLTFEVPQIFRPARK